MPQQNKAYLILHICPEFSEFDISNLTSNRISTTLCVNNQNMIKSVQFLHRIVMSHLLLFSFALLHSGQDSGDTIRHKTIKSFKLIQACLMKSRLQYKYSTLIIAKKSKVKSSHVYFVQSWLDALYKNNHVL